MLQEENESVLQGLVSSVNDIEQGVQKPFPTFDDVDMLDYVPAVVETQAHPKRAWLRPLLATVGVLLLVGVVAFVGVMMWSPDQLAEMKQDDGGVTTTTIEIEVWDGELPPNCFDNPSHPLCSPNDPPGDIMEKTMNAIQREQNNIDPISPENLLKHFEGSQ